MIGADGKIVAPKVEKTFIQKYWIYSIPIILVLLIPPGPESAAVDPVKKAA